MLKRHWWLLATTAIFAAGAANAQSPAPDLDKVDRMQRQMEQLQEQMKQVKSELVEAKRKAAEAKAEVPPAFNGAYGADKPFPAKAAPSIVDKVKLTWGGFLEADTVYRTHNEVADIGTNFSAIPYPFSPLYGENEFHGSARGSRLSLLAEGALDPVQKLSGYYEMDFLGVSVVSNYNQSNSWAARMRQGYFTYDNTEWGFHVLAGQAWSLLTQNKIGITPRQENIPLTADHNYVVGFDFTRNWQLRVVKDFGSWASFGLSIENPAELVYAGTGAVANGGNVGGWLVNFQNAGSSFLGSGGYANNFTTDVAPDIIGKVALDPGWGHYEALHRRRQHPLPGPAKPEDHERGGRRRFGAVAHLAQIRRLPGLGHVRQGHWPLWRLGIVRCRCRARWVLVAHQSGPRIDRDCRAPLGRVGRLRLCRNGTGAAQLLEHRLHGLSEQPDRLRHSDCDQHRMQYYHRGLVHRRDLELRGHQQGVGGGHRRLLAGLLQRQLWSRCRRVRVGIRPPLVVPRRGRDRRHSCGPGSLTWVGWLGLDVGQRLHDVAALLPVLTFAPNQQEKFV